MIKLYRAVKLREVLSFLHRARKGLATNIYIYIYIYIWPILCILVLGASLLSCGDADAGGDTSTASGPPPTLELKEFPKADATNDKRPEYLALQITSTTNTGKYIIAVKKASETAPTASDMQTSKGSYIRTVEKLPKDAVIAVFHPIGFDRSTISFNTAVADKASIKSSTGDSYLLTPSTAYKVYGMADGGDTVRDYNLTISTDAAYTTIKAANSVMDSSMWGLNASQNITLSVAESPFIVPGAFYNASETRFQFKILAVEANGVILTYDDDTSRFLFGAGYSIYIFNQIIPSIYTSEPFKSDATSSSYLMFTNSLFKGTQEERFSIVDSTLSNSDWDFSSKFKVVKEE